MTVAQIGDKVMVENPYWKSGQAEDRVNPRFTEARINPRESAIYELVKKKVIDYAQAQAADRFRAFFERMGGRGVQAIDYGKEPVDGGGHYDPHDVSQLEAGRELDRCRSLLGVYDFNLVELVAGKRHSLHEICGSRRDREFTSWRLRLALTALAQMWKLQTKPSNRTVVKPLPARKSA